MTDEGPGQSYVDRAVLMMTIGTHLHLAMPVGADRHEKTLQFTGVPSRDQRLRGHRVQRRDALAAHSAGADDPGPVPASRAAASGATTVLVSQPPSLAPSRPREQPGAPSRADTGATRFLPRPSGVAYWSHLRGSA